MNGLLNLLHSELGQRLTWTLLHFVWQGLAVALLLAALMWILGVRKAHTRYALSVLALLAMVACLPATFALMEFSPPNLATHAAEMTPSPQSNNTADVAWRVEQPPVPANRHFAQPMEMEGPPQPLATISTPSADQKAAATASLPAKLDFAMILSILQPYMLMLWGLGVMLLSLRLLLGIAGLSRVKEGKTPVTAEIAHGVSRLAKRLGIAAIPPAFSSLRVAEAVAVGFLKPVILIPAAWLAEMTPDMLEAVVAHELAHIRAGISG